MMMGRKRILIVEDNSLVALAEAEYLMNSGYEVIQALSGSEALRLFRRMTAIDLVLMDIELGTGIDGVEAARAISAIRAVPIIFVSVHPEQRVRDRIAGFPHRGYVDKKRAAGDLLLRAVEAALAPPRPLGEPNRPAEQPARAPIHQVGKPIE